MLLRGVQARPRLDRPDGDGPEDQAYHEPDPGHERAHTLATLRDCCIRPDDIAGLRRGLRDPAPCVAQHQLLRHHAVGHRAERHKGCLGTVAADGDVCQQLRSLDATVCDLPRELDDAPADTLRQVYWRAHHIIPGDATLDLALRGLCRLHTRPALRCQGRAPKRPRCNAASLRAPCLLVPCTRARDCPREPRGLCGLRSWPALRCRRSALRRNPAGYRVPRLPVPCTRARGARLLLFRCRPGRIRHLWSRGHLLLQPHFRLQAHSNAEVLNRGLPHAPQESARVAVQGPRVSLQHAGVHSGRWEELLEEVTHRRSPPLPCLLPRHQLYQNGAHGLRSTGAVVAKSEPLKVCLPQGEEEAPLARKEVQEKRCQHVRSHHGHPKPPTIHFQVGQAEAGEFLRVPPCRCIRREQNTRDGGASRAELEAQHAEADHDRAVEA
mmetsp:Transcript_52019/g.166614  ORF Transcript_52019/g.166614 Transcript_52019/m.166614 type:complete len:439 (-) Transcript_52019:74-1390(-)